MKIRTAQRVTDKKNIRLKKMVSIGSAPAAGKDDAAPMIYLTPEQAVAMEDLKEAITRPADDPRRMGNMQDAIYILTHGDNAMSEADVQKEIDAFLATREKEAQDRAKKLAETFADMTGKTQSPANPAPQPKPRASGIRPFY